MIKLPVVSLFAALLFLAFGAHPGPRPTHM